MDPRAGDDLEEVETKDIAFQDVASTPGACLKVSQPWPEDALPPVTASLLSVASKNGLMAAAGPDALVIVSTAKATQQYLARRKKDDEQDKVRQLDADVRLSIPRVSHVAFSADETCLVIAAQQGGGLAVYETAKLSNNAQPAFQIPTNGTSVRHLLPNPNPSADTSHLFGIVLSDGNLLLADLKKQALVQTQNGPVFHDTVTSAAWSKLGKQIIAGLADSTCVQLDPQGNIKDTIPRPPQLQQLQADYEGAQALPVTSITWISTYEFLLVFSPSYPDGNDAGRLDSAYFIAKKTKGTPFNMQKISMDPCAPFGMMSRTPSHHFLLRFNEWLNIKNMVVLASTSSTDIGIFAHFFANQAKGLPDNFVTATIPDDRNQRAMMPYSDQLSSDSSPVGVALDLGTKIVAPAPVFNEADLFPNSTIPLPALCILGNDGNLLMWWVIYNDAVRNKVVYPGMAHQNGRFTKYKKFNKVDLDNIVAASDSQFANQESQDSGDELDVGDPSAPGALSSAVGASSTPASALGASSFNQQPTPARPDFGQSAFGQPPKPAFGQAGAPGFGSAGGLGQKSSPWGTPENAPTPAQAQPAKPTFGQAGAIGFGSAGGLGQTASPWGTPAKTAPEMGLGFGHPHALSGPSGFAQLGATGGASPFSNPSTADGDGLFTTGKPYAPSSTFGRPSSGPYSTSPFSNPLSNPPAADRHLSGLFTSSKPSAPSTFGQPSTPSSSWGLSGQPRPAGFANTSSESPGTLFGGNTSAASPFMSVGAGKDDKAGLFGSKASAPSPFMSVGASNDTKPNPFMAHLAKQKSPLSKEDSTASTATIGSSFGSGSPFAGSSFGSKPTISQESTMKDDEESTKQPEQSDAGSGLFGSGGFKLGSGFKGDGSAKDDLPKPKNPGGLSFGSDMFGNALNDISKNPSPFIKKEPGTEEQPTLKDIPAAKPQEKEPPLPPDFTKPAAKGIPDDAPLPPDPSTATKALPDDAPLPPDPSTYKAPKMDDIPLPGFDKPADKDIPIAGSPPVNVTNSQAFSSANSSEAAGPSDEGSENWEDDADGSDEEDGEDSEEYDEEDEEDEEDDEDDEDETGKPVVDDPVRHNAFMNRVTPASPKKPGPEGDEKTPEPPKPGRRERAATPESEEKTIHSSYTPAGLPPGPKFDPPKGRPILSPRSPSPRRAVTSPARSAAVPEDLPPQIKTTAVPPAKPTPRPKAAPPKPKEPTQDDLLDEADERLNKHLASAPEPTKDLPKFYTHADYQGTSDSPDLPGHIMKVFRDVNSMIHVVGLNAKGLENFVLGHEQLKKEGQRTREDLDDEEAWCIGEVGALGQLIDAIDRQLQNGKLENAQQKVDSLSDEQKELLRLKSNTAEIRKQIAAHTDAEKLAMQEAAPLPTETQTQQSELRQSVQRVQRLLSEVEQKMTMLRADLASLPKDGERSAMPTVEAVTNTIVKMTAMVEQKSGDIDVLEAQIRRLPGGLAALRLDDDYEDQLVGRLALTASTTPKRARMAANGDALGMSAMFGMSSASRSRFQTPPSGFGRSSGLGRSGGLSGSARKKMVDVTAEEVHSYYERVSRRKNVLEALKGRVEGRGVRVVKVE